MPCPHLQQLYTLCEKHGLKLSSSEVIRVVCPICGLEDRCPDNLLCEYEHRHGTETRGETSSANLHDDKRVEK